jgi:glycine oxidase
MEVVTSSSRTADVIVIGGGLIGSSLALRLAQAKLRVLVFDRGEPGAEASRAAAGMIAPQGESVEPDAFFALCARSHALFPDYVGEIEELSGQEVDFRRQGSLLVAVEEKQVAELEKLFWTQTRAGLPLERLTPAGLEQRMPGLSPEVRLALGVSEDHWVDNEKLTAAVIEAARRLGVRFHAHCAVNELRVREDRVEAILAGPAENGSALFSAGCFVLAAGCWSGDLAAGVGLPLPLEPCRGQMMEFESPREIPHVIRAGIHYLVPRSGRRLLIGTTAEYAGFEKTVTAGGMQSILEGAARFAPFLKECFFRRAWAGLRPDTSDHLPILGYGRLRNLALATGHFRHGILLAPLTAQLVSDLVLERPAGVVPEAYRPGRFAVRNGRGA